MSNAVFLPHLQPRLETDRLILRGFAEEDLAPFTRLRGDPDAARYLGGTLDAYQSWRAFAGVLGHLLLRGYSEYAWVERASGRFVGYGGHWRPEGWPDREIGWHLAPAFQGQGLAREAAEACIADARDRLGWPSAVSIVDPENAPSRRLAQRLGAREDGTWVDPSGYTDILYRHAIGGAGAQPEAFGDMPLLPAHQPVLETERLLLRPFAAADFAPFAALYADPEAARFIGGPAPADAAWRRFATNIGHVPLRGYGPFSVTLKTDGTWIGFSGPWYPLGKPGREIMWALAPAFHGQGYAAEAACRLLDYAAQDLGWNDALSVIAPANTPSRRLAERLGAEAGEAWTDMSGHETILYRHDLSARGPQSSTTSPG